jgi:hypothetical protein
MGVPQSRCCCREDGDEGGTEAAGKIPTNYSSGDQEHPIYNGSTVHPDSVAIDEASNQFGPWSEEYFGGHELLAPAPEIGDEVGGNLALPAATSSSKKGKKKKVHSTQQDSAEADFDLQVQQSGEPDNEEIVQTRVYGFPGMILQINLDTGWSEYDDADLKQINDHLKAGSTKFVINSRGTMYMIDFTDDSNIVQTNSLTKKTRNLRLILEGTRDDEVQNGIEVLEATAGQKVVGKEQPKKQVQRCCVIS